MTFPKNGLEKGSHCSYCGSPFPREEPWPRTCDRCRHTSFKNPIPVAVVLVPVDDGLVFIRRSIEPKKGRLALPGGYINAGETWQEAGAREGLEETGISLNPREIQEFMVRSAPDDTLLIFGRARPRDARDLPAFQVTDETTERVVLPFSPPDQAFRLHGDAAAAHFDQTGLRNPRPRIGVAAIVGKDGKVLLGKRRNAHGDGTWQFPGGHLEYGESVEDCARREVWEEAGIRICDLRIGPYTNDRFEAERKHYITLFVTARYESGSVRRREPHKCGQWAWFRWSRLPEPRFLPIQNLMKTGFRPDGLSR